MKKSLLTRHHDQLTVQKAPCICSICGSAYGRNFNRNHIELNGLLVFLKAMHIKLCNFSDFHLLAIID